MTTITFDTLKFARTLKDAGIPDSQAEAFAVAFRDATSEELVTRDYLNLRVADVETKIEAAKADIIKWLAGLLLAQAALIAALVKLL
ncbi:DUF1640 domain-containing protein [Thiocystis minor]|uniref:DUF1640 domain-containing protein n=1 Tax=Thiocystis minor TaxID=61597 RepID=UPI001913E8D8|nr:DUF1640 domain-containing protein [Thiocystis minor]MBK5962895.1 DUF1640 domain-containing protein [Thiocystis minor]